MRYRRGYELLIEHLRVVEDAHRTRALAEATRERSQQARLAHAEAAGRSYEILARSFDLGIRLEKDGVSVPNDVVGIDADGGMSIDGGPARMVVIRRSDVPPS